LGQSIDPDHIWHVPGFFFVFFLLQWLEMGAVRETIVSINKVVVNVGCYINIAGQKPVSRRMLELHLPQIRCFLLFFLSSW
jgi:hypothetical protein